MHKQKHQHPPKDYLNDRDTLPVASAKSSYLALLPQGINWVLVSLALRIVMSDDLIFRIFLNHRISVC